MDKELVRLQGEISKAIMKYGEVAPGLGYINQITVRKNIIAKRLKFAGISDQERNELERQQQ